MLLLFYSPFIVLIHVDTEAVKAHALTNVQAAVERHRSKVRERKRES